MTQRNQNYGVSPNDTTMSPARRMFVIAPSDTVAIDPLPKSVRFDGAGAVTARAIDSTVDVVFNVVAGEQIDVRFQYIRDTGTDAITIHGFA